MVGPHVGPTTKASASKTCRENKPRARRAARTAGQLHVPSALLFGTPIAFGSRQFYVAMAAISACFVILWPEIGLAAWPSCAETGSSFIPTPHIHTLFPPHPCSANKRCAARARRTAAYAVHIQCSLCFSERMCTALSIIATNVSAGARSHR